MAKPDSISIVLCGEAGQGIQTIEALLTKVLKDAGYHIFASKEYMSRIRGGSNSTEIRVASRRIAAYAETIDLLIPLDREAIPHLKERISAATKILGETAKIMAPDPLSVIDVPFSEIAAAIGNPVFANTVACGLIAGLFAVRPELLADNLQKYFAAKPAEIIAQNQRAAEQGYQVGLRLHDSGQIVFDLPSDPSIRDEMILNGAEAVALGAVAGGCNFIASYPMSPGTGVLIYLAQYSSDFPILCEQAEDEISAVNMALGAWYAGARAIVTTSGGGFDLMTEGLSLAGMIESPLVIHLAQRPGPATGLPTRTEQADLELALYAGHGEFPRIILAPGTLAEAFALTRQAFDFAARFQVPVFILTDQFLVDSFANLPVFPLTDLKNESHLVETGPDYRRYQLTPNGLSPRGIPGYGQGLVAADSDEHDESGHITEDAAVRIQMMQKRLQKLEMLQNEVIPPEFHGEPDYHTLVIGWGSTYSAIREALQQCAEPGWAFLHFKQVYPLHPLTGSYLEKAARIVIVENNATAQLGKLLKLHTGVAAQHLILKYDGLPFAVEELAKQFALIAAAR